MNIEAGQEVWLGDVNRKERTRGTVTKVGRKLLTIRDAWGNERAYRMDSGHVNDQYGHQWYATDEEMELRDRRQDAFAVLRGAGLSLEFRCALSVDALEAIAEVVRGDQENPK